MTYLTALMIVVLSIGVSALASGVVQRTLHIELRRRHHEVGNSVFLQLGVMFAVLLAFVFSETWGEYNTASQAITGECAGLHGVAMLAESLPKPQAQGVNQAILSYAHEVADTEWPMMAHRQGSPQAGERFRAIISAIASPNLRPADIAIQGEMLSLMSQASADREVRLFQMTSGLPKAIWFVLFLLAMVLVGSVLLAGVEVPGHLLFSGAFTGCIVLILLLVRMLDYPFEGALALGDAGFLKMMNEVAMLAAA